MSFLINLLPDIHQAKLRDKRRRQLMSGLAVGIWIVCGGVVLLMSIIWASQKAIIAVKSKSINDKSAQLSQIPNILDALTAQQHLEVLPGLYGRRVYITKFLNAYASANPAELALNSLTLDATNALKVSGTARSYASVAKLARALEQYNLTIGPGADISNAPYFTNIAISDVGAESTGRITFIMDMNVGTGAFNNGK